MTVSSVNLTHLRNAKNAVIGNPSAKLQLARDPSFVGSLVDCLNLHDARTEIRVEAAHVVTSLSYGSPEALLSLLQSNAPHALLYAIAHLSSTAPPALLAAFARALRAIAVSAADAVGPSLWGLGPETSIAAHDAQDALELLFHPDALDTILPLLLLPSLFHVPTTTSIAQLLASALRVRQHRAAVSEWVPPSERSKLKEKEKDPRPRRGWEKAVPAPVGGWVARTLVGLLASRNVKLQEAALGALAALAKDSPDVSSILSRTGTDRDPSPLATVLTLAKSRSPDVQLAACLCAAHILRALPRQHQDESHTRLVMNTLNRMIASPLSLSDLHDTANGSEGSGAGALGQVTMAQRARACFVLCEFNVLSLLWRLIGSTDHLVSDDASLCQTAFDRGCLAQLVGLVTALPTPPAPASLLADVVTDVKMKDVGSGGNGGTGEEEEEEWVEPEGRAALREAALTAIAAISLFDNDVRRSLTEPSTHPSYHHPTPAPSSSQPSLLASPSFPPTSTTPHSFSRSPTPPSNSSTGGGELLPLLLQGLAHPSAGVRAVAVLRTNIVDSGLGVGVWRRCVRGSALPKSQDGREDEERKGEGEGEKDRRVLGAGLAVVCNLVNGFSPLRSVLLEDGLVERLNQILGYEEPALRVSALWALKNLVYRSGGEVKRGVGGVVGWERLVGFIKGGEGTEGERGGVEGEREKEEVREQALNVLRNLTEDEEGVGVVVEGVGEGVLLDCVAASLKSGNNDIVLQAAYLLANLANDPDAPLQKSILSHPGILPALHSALIAATTTAPLPSSSPLISSSPFPLSPTSHSSASHISSHALHNTSTTHQARGPLVACVAQLVVSGANEVRRAGFEGALRHVAEFGGVLGGRGGGEGEERHVAERARGALRVLETNWS
ncbi:hypothetical protein DXG01_010276 [Tephrocybe rancida]|nr:hypothetical protein DXG01_010276 [Tephrocybe rancida]